MTPRYLIWLVILLITSGCAGMNAKNQASQLDSAVTEYGAALRWGRINAAYAFHQKRDGLQPPADLKIFDHIGITDFMPINTVMEQSGTEATITSEISYFDKEYGTVKKITETQHWWFNAEKKLWLIESDFPKFP